MINPNYGIRKGGDKFQHIMTGNNTDRKGGAFISGKYNRKHISW